MNERTETIFERVELAIIQLRRIRNCAQKGKGVDPSDFKELESLINSLRHNCEMQTREIAEENR